MYMFIFQYSIRDANAGCVVYYQADVYAFNTLLEMPASLASLYLYVVRNYAFQYSIRDALRTPATWRGTA